MKSRVLKAIPLGLLLGLLGLLVSFVQFFHDFEEDTGLGLLMNYPAASGGVSKSQRLGEFQAQQAVGNRPTEIEVTK